MVPSLVLVGLAFHLVSRADMLVLGVVATPRDVGLYAAASRGGEAVLIVYDAVTLAGGALFAALHARGDRQELQRFTSLACRVVLWGTVPVYLTLMAITPWFLGLFGAEFVAGAAAMRVLLTTYSLSSISGFVMVMLYMVGHPRDVAAVVSLLMPFTLALDVLLIPPFGPIGAAAASGVSLLLMKGILVVVLYRRTGVLALPYGARHFGRLAREGAA
jgi:O-antigen/teichoic acid export membrane protein